MTKNLIPKLIALINIFILFTGCTAFRQPAYIRANPQTEYYDQIRDWQERFKKEGWSKSGVDEVVKTCLKFSKYTMEEEDYWFTAKEMVEAGFRGDCEDIAFLIYGTLKELEYPYQARILVVRVLYTFSDHALIKVELPNGKWKTYQTVDTILHQFEPYFPFLEFDENEIWVF